jgi:ssDNA-binding Zn-finger/Zn-ribbon topoisomerase 1
MSGQSLTCPDCGGTMRLKSSRFGPFYGCSNWPACDCTHGAHPNGEPLGIPADKETRQARTAAHAVFDPLWQNWQEAYSGAPEPGRKKAKDNNLKRAARYRAYVWLASTLDLPFSECHIGLFDKATCARVIHACKGMDSTQVRAWARAHRVGKRPPEDLDETICSVCHKALDGKADDPYMCSHCEDRAQRESWEAERLHDEQIEESAEIERQAHEDMLDAQYDRDMEACWAAAHQGHLQESEA